MIERYSRPQMSRLWSDEHRLALLVQVETAYLEVLARGKKIPPAEIKTFKQALKESLLAQAKSAEGTSKHEVLGILSAVQKRIEGKAPNLSRYLHYGLTSSDLLDTAFALQLRETAELLVRDWQKVSAALKALASKHKLAWMAGRTHGVHAQPITFGMKLAGWNAEALRNIERLRRAEKDIAFGKISGAVGNYAFVEPDQEAQVCAALGLLPEPVSTQIVPRDRHADYFHALVLSAAAIERFATEIRHLQRTEVLELEEPFTEGQKGSSAMPHKRNPVLCENLCGLSRLIRSYEGAVVENVVLWHERDISHSSVERIVFPDAAILLDFMLGRFLEVLDGLHVDARRMAENLKSTGGLIFSQGLLVKLIDKGWNRDRAYDAVQRNAMKAIKTGQSFQELFAADPSVKSVLSRAEIAACFNLSSYGRHVPEILRRGGVS